MSQAKSPPAIDLSSLPPAIRQQVEAGLAKLPPEMRQQLLEKGSPILDKAIARAQAKLGPQAARVAESARSMASGRHDQPHARGIVHAAVIPRYDGHFNNTVRAGDRVSMRSWMIAALILGVAAWAWGL